MDVEYACTNLRKKKKWWAMRTFGTLACRGSWHVVVPRTPVEMWCAKCWRFARNSVVEKASIEFAVGRQMGFRGEAGSKGSHSVDRLAM